MIITDKQGRKHYILLNVYNTVTGSHEDVEVERDVYLTYCRSNWNMSKKNGDVREHETPFSAMNGSDDGSFDHFHEFASEEDNPAQLSKKQKLLDLAESILDTCLTPTQKKRYLLAKYYKLPTTEIAKIEMVSMSAVSISIRNAQKKLKKQIEK
jgi:DNA-directed RNA polymerase specialized sigma24 family protein